MSLTFGKFTKVNEGFQCAHCLRQVPPQSASCRNHCPFCLHSKHVDLHPGDRQNPCHGLMEPRGYETNAKKGLVLVFKCLKCGAEGRNVAALDCKNQPDDYDLILKLSQKP
jgi:hypothetical protein